MPAPRARRSPEVVEVAIETGTRAPARRLGMRRLEARFSLAGTDAKAPVGGELATLA